MVVEVAQILLRFVGRWLGWLLVVFSYFSPFVLLLLCRYDYRVSTRGVVFQKQINKNLPAGFVLIILGGVGVGAVVLGAFPSPSHSFVCFSLVPLFFSEIAIKFWEETEKERIITTQVNEREEEEEALEQEEKGEEGERRGGREGAEFDWERTPGWKEKEAKRGKEKKKKKGREGRVLMTKANREKLVGLLQVGREDFFLVNSLIDI